MNENQANFIQNLKFYRKRAGISQAQLAESCDVSNGTIGNIECGVTKPSFDLIFSIAKSLSIHPSDLFRESIKDTKLSVSQMEIVSKTVNTVVNEAVTKALQDLTFNIEH